SVTGVIAPLRKSRRHRLWGVVKTSTTIPCPSGKSARCVYGRGATGIGTCVPWRRMVFEDRDGQAGLAFSGERLRAGQHLVERDAEGEDVGARVDVPALDLLRRHVLHGADDRARR